MSQKLSEKPVESLFFYKLSSIKRALIKFGLSVNCVFTSVDSSRTRGVASASYVWRVRVAATERVAKRAFLLFDSPDLSRFGINFLCARSNLKLLALLRKFVLKFSDEAPSLLFLGAGSWTPGPIFQYFRKSSKKKFGHQPTDVSVISGFNPTFWKKNVEVFARVRGILSLWGSNTDRNRGRTPPPSTWATRVSGHICLDTAPWNLPWTGCFVCQLILWNKWNKQFKVEDRQTVPQGILLSAARHLRPSPADCVYVLKWRDATNFLHYSRLEVSLCCKCLSPQRLLPRDRTSNHCELNPVSMEDEEPTALVCLSRSPCRCWPCEWGIVHVQEGVCSHFCPGSSVVVCFQEPSTNVWKPQHL